MELGWAMSMAAVGAQVGKITTNWVGSHPPHAMVSGADQVKNGKTTCIYFCQYGRMQPLAERIEIKRVGHYTGKLKNIYLFALLTK